MFTLRLNLTLLLFLALIAACAAPQSLNVQGAQIQNNAVVETSQQQSPNALTTATPVAASALNLPLQVLSTSPQNNAREISVARSETKIIVQFNHPVVPDRKSVV